MTTEVDIFNDFAVNETAAKDGVWVPYRGDIEFLIAKSGNKNYRKNAQVLFKRHARLLDQNDDAAEAKGRELLIELTARTILLGWKGTVKYQGEPLVYSVENAKKLLDQDGFREWVDTQSKDQARYKAVQDEEDTKN